MKIGTKSLLFGAHQFILHPIAVARAWRELYGFPYDPRLWIAFFLHDVGYLGKPNMDGLQGELHPFTGACIMGVFFGEHWYDFCLGHSRSLIKKLGGKTSDLCHADKLAFSKQVKWLYLLGVKCTGEIHEYMENARKYNEKKGFTVIRVDSPESWYADMVQYMSCVAYAGINQSNSINKTSILSV